MALMAFPQRPRVLVEDAAPLLPLCLLSWEVHLLDRPRERHYTLLSLLVVRRLSLYEASSLVGREGALGRLLRAVYNGRYSSSAAGGGGGKVD